MNIRHYINLVKELNEAIVDDHKGMQIAQDEKPRKPKRKDLQKLLLRKGGGMHQLDMAGEKIKTNILMGRRNMKPMKPVLTV